MGAGSPRAQLLLQLPGGHGIATVAAIQKRHISCKGASGHEAPVVSDPKLFGESQLDHCVVAASRSLLARRLILILYAADRICTPESCITDSGVLAAHGWRV